MPFVPRIGIVGGGPSGLALNILLKRKGLSSTIFELRNRPTADELALPSGVLDLHEESGLMAMRECDLWDDFVGATGECSEHLKIVNKLGEVLHEDDGGAEPRPEISRNALTAIFLKKVSPYSINWNQKVLSAASSFNPATGGKEITIHTPQRTHTFDFVIGADGAWSKVRNLLSDVKPFYSGATLLTVTARNVTERFPHLLELTGSGTFNALGGGYGVMSQRASQDSLRVYAQIKTSSEHWVIDNGLEGKSAEEILPFLLQNNGAFSGYAPSIKELLSIACKEDSKDNPGKAATVMPLYMLAVGMRWTNQTGITLVGDAAHLMTPYAGEGVNLALWDSVELARALSDVSEVQSVAEWQAKVDRNIKSYEDAMFIRTTEKAKETANNKELFLRDDSAEVLANIFHEHTK